MNAPAHIAPQRARPLLGPDLTIGPTLADQLALLDDALGDPAVYAEVWTDVQTQNTGGPGYVTWKRSDPDDHEGRLWLGFTACDGQERERSARLQAIADHLPDLPAYRQAILHRLISLKSFLDNRPVARDRLFAATRELLATGGRLMLDTQGRLHCSPGWPAGRDDVRSEAEDARAYAAGVSFVRLLRRHEARKPVHRIVTLAGARLSNGWVLLERRS